MDGPQAASLAEAKAYLRIEHGEEDVLIDGLIAAATGVCEAFLGTALVRRTIVEEFAAPVWWRPLSTMPVVAITQVADGAGGVLPPAAYAIDIDGEARGLVRVTVPGVSRIVVTYQAGLAAEAAEVPAAIRQGIVRLAAHLHAHRDDDSGPPAAVAALWRPYRRVRL